MSTKVLPSPRDADQNNDTQEVKKRQANGIHTFH